MSKPTPDTAIEPALPTLWLVGKTGAGKTSVVRALTGEGAVGDGLRPTTRGLSLHAFPTPAPVVRFLDTRGLDEVGYDAQADIDAARAQAQAALVVIRLDDSDIESLEPAIRGTRLPVLALFTGADLVPDAAARDAARFGALTALGQWTKAPVAQIDMALPQTGMVSGVEALLEALDGFMPTAVAALRRLDEARSFARLRPVVLRYAGMAGGADTLPLVGAAAVPAMQAAMLNALAREHGVTLTTARLGVLASALGVGTLARLGATHLVRQGAKMVPVVGQTLGAAAAAGASFATTYALGRAGSAWLHGMARGAPADPASLRALYDQALRGSAGAKTP